MWQLTASPKFWFFIWIVTLLLLSHRAVLEISENGDEWAACMHKGVYFILCISLEGGKGIREKKPLWPLSGVWLIVGNGGGALFIGFSTGNTKWEREKTKNGLSKWAAFSLPLQPPAVKPPAPFWLCTGMCQLECFLKSWSVAPRQLFHGIVNTAFSVSLAT